MIVFLLSCASSSNQSTPIIDTDSGFEDTGEDTGEDTSDLPLYLLYDQDEDGFLSWQVEHNPELADCDDFDPTITPNKERFVQEGSFPFGESGTDLDLSSFCIDRLEVDNEQFVAFMEHQRLNGFPNQTSDGLPLFDFEDNDDEYPERIVLRTDGKYEAKVGFEQHPVVEVWYWAAQAYCQWNNKDLPSEEQWEKAARGTAGSTFPWGEEQPHCELANYWPRTETGEPAERCVDDTVVTVSYPQGASPYGALNMAGNVAEWVEGYFSDTERLSRGGSLGTE